jgi:outer membrane protein OmpA-like peptidoglycan-associated protein
MKNLQIAFGLVALLALSACTNTLQGIQKDINNPSQPERMGRPAQTQDSPVERFIDNLPTGYAGQNPVWGQVDSYDANYPSLPDETPMPMASTDSGMKYNNSVDLFPVDDTDVSPYATVRGEMVQQIFFAYGSDNLSRMERKNLRELGSSLNTSTGYGLSVVGHASKRVDGVSDPVQKKMINLEMAQKRANAVTSELLAAGANPNWVTAVSMGDKEPNMHPGGMAQEPADRRVEIYLDTH